MLGFGPIFIFLNPIPFLMGNKESREAEGGGQFPGILSQCQLFMTTKDGRQMPSMGLFFRLLTSGGLKDWGWQNKNSLQLDGDFLFY